MLNYIPYLNTNLTS